MTIEEALEELLSVVDPVEAVVAEVAAFVEVAVEADVTPVVALDVVTPVVWAAAVVIPVVAMTPVVGVRAPVVGVTPDVPAVVLGPAVLMAEELAPVRSKVGVATKTPLGEAKKTV